MFGWWDCNVFGAVEVGFSVLAVLTDCFLVFLFSSFVDGVFSVCWSMSFSLFSARVSCFLFSGCDWDECFGSLFFSVDWSWVFSDDWRASLDLEVALSDSSWLFWYSWVFSWGCEDEVFWLDSLGYVVSRVDNLSLDSWGCCESGLSWGSFWSCDLVDSWDSEGLSLELLWLTLSFSDLVSVDWVSVGLLSGSSCLLSWVAVLSCVDVLSDVCSPSFVFLDGRTSWLSDSSFSVSIASDASEVSLWLVASVVLSNVWFWVFSLSWGCCIGSVCCAWEGCVDSVCWGWECCVDSVCCGWEVLEDVNSDLLVCDSLSSKSFWTFWVVWFECEGVWTCWFVSSAACACCPQ